MLTGFEHVADGQRLACPSVRVEQREEIDVHLRLVMLEEGLRFAGPDVAPKSGRVQAHFFPNLYERLLAGNVLGIQCDNFHQSPQEPLSKLLPLKLGRLERYAGRPSRLHPRFEVVFVVRGHPSQRSAFRYPRLQRLIIDDVVFSPPLGHVVGDAPHLVDNVNLVPVDFLQPAEDGLEPPAPPAPGVCEVYDVYEIAMPVFAGYHGRPSCGPAYRMDESRPPVMYKPDDA